MSAPSPPPLSSSGGHTGRWLAGLVALGVLWLLAMAWLEPGQRLGLEAAREALASWQARVQQSPGQAALVFVGVYTALAALALPGALVLTLVGGALFGLVWGTLLVLLAATAGATLAMLLSRYLLRPLVVRLWQARYEALRPRLERDGARFLLSLRLLPVVPFFLLNLLMGLAPLPTRTYVGVSLLGMLPATLVYVHAGTALAQLRSTADVLSLPVMASLAMLAALPWLSRRAAWRLQRPAGAAWVRPRRFDRNLVVIGGGAGGLVAAYMAAALKARVSLVEAHRLGGDCLYTGCVPSKALIHAARVAEQVRQAHRVGVQAAPPEIDWPALMQRVQGVIAAIEPHDSAERYAGLGVDVLQGRAKIIDPWTVEVSGPSGLQRLSTRAIVIATGARPVVPPLPGLEQMPHVTSDTLWTHLAALPRLPQRLMFLGGGPMGCELAQAFARLGAQVTLVEQGAQLLSREDEDVAQAAQQALQAAGVQVRLGSHALRCEPGQVWLSTPAGEQALPCDLLVLALGRTPQTDGLGLEALGLDLSRGLQVDAYLQTAVPGIYAVGDVAGPWQLTHAAAHQGWHAAFNALLGARTLRADRVCMPQVLFMDPEIARVGLNEREARAQGQAYELTRLDLGGLDRALTDGQAQGFIKLLTVPGRDRLLGVSIVGPQAGEWLAEYALAMRHGLGLQKILASVHAYPTFAEANRQAAGAWKRAHQRPWVLRWLAGWHAWRRG